MDDKGRKRRPTHLNPEIVGGFIQVDVTVVRVHQFHKFIRQTLQRRVPFLPTVTLWGIRLPDARNEQP